MDISLRLERANKRVIDINKAMHDVEEAEKAIEDAGLCNTVLIGKEDVNFRLATLSDTFVNDLLTGIREELQCEADRRIKHLDELLGDAEKPPEEKTVEQPKPKGRPRTKLTDEDKEQIRNLYLKENKSLQDIAAVLWIDKKVVFNYIEDSHIKKPIAKTNDPFIDANRTTKDEFKSKMLKDQEKKK